MEIKNNSIIFHNIDTNDIEIIEDTSVAFMWILLRNFMPKSTKNTNWFNELEKHNYDNCFEINWEPNKTNYSIFRAKNVSTKSNVNKNSEYKSVIKKEAINYGFGGWCISDLNLNNTYFEKESITMKEVYDSFK